MKATALTTEMLVKFVVVALGVIILAIIMESGVLEVKKDAAEQAFN